jgi:hypothetical protein
MAKINSAPKGKTTYHDDKMPKAQSWKLDRYEQRMAKTSARRTITGGF